MVRGAEARDQLIGIGGTVKGKGGKAVPPLSFRQEMPFFRV
ncbi:MAG: hypothetical protein QOD09_4149 [Bradyrhizobium sp.]|jgi:hypothetical protein|nr:hypothetical protein [Bradyrhizobium sp.]